MKARSRVPKDGGGSRSTPPDRKHRSGVGTFEAGARSRTVLENGTITGYNLVNGTATLTDGNGTKLEIQYSGYIYESGPIYAFTWTGTIVGGTGEYRNAAGSFDTYGTYSVTTGEFTDSRRITLTLTDAHGGSRTQNFS